MANKYSKMREENRKQRERTKRFEPVDTSGLDRHGDGFPVVSDDDPEVAADLAAKTAELETAAAEAVAGMQQAQPEPPEPQSEPESQPEPAPVPKKARPAQDPEPTPMTGVVTEKPAPAPEPKSAPVKKKARPAQDPEPKPAPTVTPEQLATQERRRAMLGTEISAEIAEKFASGEYEEDLAEFRAEQHVLEDEIAFLRMKERERRAKLEAAKWKTILVVKDDDGRWQFLVDAWKAATKAIDLIPGLDAELKRTMRTAATEDLYQRAEARQRHSETGEVRRYESRDLATLKKEEWRQAYDAAQAKKKAKPAGEARK